MDGIFSLGPLIFKQFEIPTSIVFGGRHRLAVTPLLDGGQVIERLGPENANIEFSGIFTGPDANFRFQALNLLRQSGTLSPLSWGEYYYTVIVSALRAEYHQSSWIRYFVSCVVVDDSVTRMIGATGDALLGLSYSSNPGNPIPTEPTGVLETAIGQTNAAVSTGDVALSVSPRSSGSVLAFSQAIARQSQNSKVDVESIAHRIRTGQFPSTKHESLHEDYFRI